MNRLETAQHVLILSIAKHVKVTIILIKITCVLNVIKLDNSKKIWLVKYALLHLTVKHALTQHLALLAFR